MGNQPRPSSLKGPAARQRYFCGGAHMLADGYAVHARGVRDVSDCGVGVGVNDHHVGAVEYWKHRESAILFQYAELVVWQGQTQYFDR